uniref:Uncharacterized protein n=1 Tax=Anguilla anguilla TaxID=7936 RepID=A0A0E9RR93_ANGAN
MEICSTCLNSHDALSKLHMSLGPVLLGLIYLSKYKPAMHIYFSMHILLSGCCLSVESKLC